MFTKCAEFWKKTRQLGVSVTWKFLLTTYGNDFEYLVVTLIGPNIKVEISLISRWKVVPTQGWKSQLDLAPTLNNDLIGKKTSI